VLEKILNSLKLKLERFSKLALIGLALILSLSLARSFARIKSADEKIDEARERVEELKREGEELEIKLEEVKSEEYVEKQLRDKLGLAKEGEIVVVLPDDEIVRKFAPNLEEEEEALPDPNWRKWIKLFL
jgi:cell division protein FtsB